MSKPPLGERLIQGAQALFDMISATPKPVRTTLEDGTCFEIEMLPPTAYGQPPCIVTRTYESTESGKLVSIRVNNFGNTIL